MISGVRQSGPALLSCTQSPRDPPVGLRLPPFRLAWMRLIVPKPAKCFATQRRKMRATAGATLNSPGRRGPCLTDGMPFDERNKHTGRWWSSCHRRIEFVHIWRTRRWAPSETCSYTCSSKIWRPRFQIPQSSETASLMTENREAIGRPVAPWLLPKRLWCCRN